MYNDYGSVARDREERSLNSLNFPEFHEDDRRGRRDIGSLEVISEDELRERLIKVAQYERGCLELSVRRLKEEVGEKTWRALMVFVNVTDLYGQIYVERDINSRMGK